MNDAPDTVTEAVEFLTAEGYVDELHLEAGALRCRDKAGAPPLDGAVVDYTFRFEGPSDPADEAIVLGITCAGLGVKGVLVSAFGPEVDEADAAILTSLARSGRPA